MAAGAARNSAASTAASGALTAEHPHTAGWPLPVVEMHIEEPDETGTGEIIVRTPSQMLGYWGEDAPEVIDADGWLHTGDLGRIDDGLLYVTGRAKDVIIRGGENIAASHVEEVLHQHGPRSQPGHGSAGLAARPLDLAAFVAKRPRELRMTAPDSLAPDGPAPDGPATRGFAILRGGVTRVRPAHRSRHCVPGQLRHDRRA